MKTIAHISDLHFGTVKPELADGLKTDIDNQQPDLLVVSGDLTQRASRREFCDARRFLSMFGMPQLIVPGNHDIPLYNVVKRFFSPMTKYQRYINREMNPSYEDSELAVYGINSARSMTIKNGRISVDQIIHLKDYFGTIARDRFKILVTHHPFMAPAQRSHIGRAERTLMTLEECRLDVLLAGHFHMSYAAGTHDTYTALGHSLLVIQAGTALSSRTRREQNAYNILRVEPGDVHLHVRAWNGRSFAERKRERYFRKRGNQWDRAK
jgi:3',5'-cyclic AMP phosphodiesterase CpdA